MGKTSKVVVLGQRESGKTSLIEQLIYGRFENEVTATIEDVYVANIESDRGVKERLRFYDTAGLEARSREVPRQYTNCADGIVLVYSVDDAESFHTVDHVKREVERNREKKEVAMIVLGNKRDLEHSRKVDAAVAASWASREKVRLFEVSARERASLLEPFVFLASKMNPPPSKSTLSGLGRRNKMAAASTEA